MARTYSLGMFFIPMMLVSWALSSDLMGSFRAGGCAAKIETTGAAQKGFPHAELGFMVFGVGTRALIGPLELRFVGQSSDRKRKRWI